MQARHYSNHARNSIYGYEFWIIYHLVLIAKSKLTRGRYWINPFQSQTRELSIFVLRYGGQIYISLPQSRIHDDVIKWKHFLRYWSFVWGIHRSPVNSPHKGQWRGALMFSLICVWINYRVNNRKAGDLRRYRVHCDATVILLSLCGNEPTSSKVTGGLPTSPLSLEIVCLTHWPLGDLNEILDK